MKGIIFILFSLFTNVLLSAQNINFRHLGIKEGLSQISVMSIIDDNYGQMWFGTRYGLNVYNGNDIRTLTISTDRGKCGFERARQLCTDNNDNIYFLSDEELVVYNKRKNFFRSLGKDIVAICYRDSTLWAVNHLNLLKYDNINNKLKINRKLEGIPSNVIIKILFCDSQGGFLIGTDKGLYLVDGSKEIRLIIPNVEVRNIYEDEDGFLWISTLSHGLIKTYNYVKVKHFRASASTENSLLSDDVRCVTRDCLGNLWIGTSKGLSKLDKSELSFCNYTSNYSNNRTLSHNSIISLYCDKRGTIWIGTYWGGIDYFNPLDEVYNYVNISYHVKNKVNINKIHPIDQENILVSSSVGLHVYNLLNKSLFDVKIPIKTNFTSFVSDNLSGKVYCGTAFGIYVYDILTKRMTGERIVMENSCLPSDYISALAYDNGQLYVATNKGFIVYDTKTKDSKPFFTDWIISTSIPSFMMVDSNKRLWIAFLSAQIIEYDISADTYIKHNEFLPKAELEQATRVNRIFQDSDLNLWAITSGRGLYRFDEHNKFFSLYLNLSDNLAFNHCYDIQEMPDKRLVVLSNTGIHLLNVQNNVFEHLWREYFTVGDIINDCSGFYINNNFNVLVGTLDGLIHFNYKDLSRRTVKNYLYFSRLFIDGEEILPQNNGIIDEMLPYVSEIQIKNGYRSFDIEISNVDYLKFNNSSFQYKLEGFDKRWNISSQNNIHYTNIGPGIYKLKVRSLDDVSNSFEEIMLTIRIFPPFYASYWAFVIYLCLLATVIFIILYIRDSKRKLRMEVEFEQREISRIENINKERIKFYINLSHELLTPISLIMAQIEMLVTDYKELGGGLKLRINRIYKNAYTLHLLIKEILNFRKKEYSQKEIKISQYNIIPILEDVVDIFRDMARLHNIDFSFTKESQEIFLFIAKDEFKKVLSNLLSNAFKYTPVGGKICVSCRSRLKSVFIEVSDTGSGIPIDKMDKIFERFYQVHDDSSKEGVGIGLSYVKDIMEQHGGNVTVRNNLSSGCTFTLEFKIGYGHLQHIESDENDILRLCDKDLEQFNENINEEIKNNDYDILIVEDNEDMLELLESAFRPIYNVHSTRSVDEALTTLQSLNPDIILSDVMLGGVSGIELCSMIKRNYDTCHIPFVLLTALDMEENFVAGFQSGADDYITKPFKVQSLIMRCNSLINNRKILQNKFTANGNYDTKMIATNENDMQFIRTAEMIVEKNLDNPNFGIDELSKELAMSRAKFYTKIKKVTGMTAKEFILNIKLKKAQYYLMNNYDMQVTDIAYKLGFNSSRVFSQAFKDLYGETPANYRRKKNHLKEN